MFQTLKSSPLLPALRPRHRAPSPPPCTAFDEALIAGLKSLPPLPPTITLSWLAAAAALLSSTLSAAPVISDSDDLAAHLDTSDALLDACNEITAATNRLIRRRLLLRLALHLLPTDHRRARATLAEWEAEVELPIPIRRSDLIRNLRTPTQPRKITAARCDVFAIEAVAALVAGAALVVLGGAKKSDVSLIHVSELFPWATAFNKVAASVYSKLPEGGAGAGEVVAVEKAVKELAAALDGGQEGEKMRIAAEEAEKAVEVLTEGVERLGKAVSCVFRAAVSVRTMWLQSFLVTCYK